MKSDEMHQVEGNSFLSPLSSARSPLSKRNQSAQDQPVHQLEPTSQPASTYCPSHSTCSCVCKHHSHHLPPVIIATSQQSPPLSQTSDKEKAENSFNRSRGRTAWVQICVPGLHFRCNKYSSQGHRIIQVGRDLRRFLDQSTAQLLHSIVSTISSAHAMWSEVVLPRTEELSQLQLPAAPSLAFGQNPARLHLLFSRICPFLLKGFKL